MTVTANKLCKTKTLFQLLPIRLLQLQPLQQLHLQHLQLLLSQA